MVAVGTELLGEDRLDTNSLRIATVLRSCGVPLVFKSVVGDDETRLTRALQQASEEADLVIVTGGLGPTQDDRTRNAAQRLTGGTLEQDQGVLDWIRAMYERRGAQMPATNARQAEVLAGSTVLQNDRGTAPGLRFEHNGATFFLLPGVPMEADGLLETALRPWLIARGLEPLAVETELRVACLPESLVEEKLASLYAAHGGDGVAILAKPGEVLIRLRGSDAQERSDMVKAVEAALGEAVFTVVEGAGQSESLEQVAVKALRDRHASLATAESCTGGLIGSRLTTVAGSSSVYAGGAVAYANQVKINILGVDAALIERYGAVSGPVAEAMAVGAAQRFATQWSISVTGVAGPGGGSEEKPVGTVWFGLAGPGVLRSRCLLFPGDRERVRWQASQYALDMLRREVLELDALEESPWMTVTRQQPPEPSEERLGGLSR